VQIDGGFAAQCALYLARLSVGERALGSQEDTSNRYKHLARLIGAELALPANCLFVNHN